MIAFDMTVILHKTTSGLQEVAHRTDRISPGARRILIMVDGKRSLGDLANFARNGELETVVDELVSKGLVDTGERTTASISVEDFLIATHTQLPRALPGNTTTELNRAAVLPHESHATEDDLTSTVQPTIQAALAQAALPVPAQVAEQAQELRKPTDPFVLATPDRLEHVRLTAAHHLKQMLGQDANSLVQEIERAQDAMSLKHAVANGQSAVQLSQGKEKARLFMQYVIVALTNAPSAVVSGAQGR